MEALLQALTLVRGLIFLASIAHATQGVFNVADYGARRGTIYVPAGRYTSGPIELFSNMTLKIDAGAVIEFPVAALPFVRGRYLGVETLMPAPLIGARDAENVAVIGRGILATADYEAWRKAYPAAYAE